MVPRFRKARLKARMFMMLSFLSLPLSRMLAGCTNGCMAGNWASACALTGNTTVVCNSFGLCHTVITDSKWRVVLPPQKEAETSKRITALCGLSQRLFGRLTSESGQ